jgi:Phosphotransferase enzyme family
MNALVLGPLVETALSIAPISETILQPLWGGYGLLGRVVLRDGRSVIVKRVRLPEAPEAGTPEWRSYDRKRRSYDVERHFYRDYASRLQGLALPQAHSAERTAEGWLFVLEDLDAAGLEARVSRPSPRQLGECLRWLARFHATYMNVPPDGLWAEGGYWHLAVRNDEFLRMPESALKREASRWDGRLRKARWRTLIHGDAKPENFCFRGAGSGRGPALGVGAVDFQYVGGGIGTKDVAYLLLSCLSEGECAVLCGDLVDEYFDALRRELTERGHAEAAPAIEAEWRALYPVAWADFCRFLEGWAPEPLHGYSRRMVQRAMSAGEAL